MGKHRAPGKESLTHPWLRTVTAIASVLILIATAIGGGAVYAINSLGKNINALDTSDLNNQERPETVVQTDTSATNILIMGSDSREGSNGTYGNVDGARSDTTLLVHVYEGREAATVVSIPRDSFVELAGCKMLDGGSSDPYKSKFNAAFAIGGPICTVKTVEKLTNVRINNFVVVDFEAFKKVVDAIGGVEVCLTSPAYDPIVPGRGGSGLDLPAGYSNITGEQALAFVRARESLGDGSDLGRIERQQEFIASMIRGMTDKGLLTNPGMIYRVLNAVTSSITTNSEFASIRALQDFALSLGSLKPSQVNFVTTPYEMVGKGNVGWTSEADELWNAVRLDQPWPLVTPSPSATPTNSTATPSDPLITPSASATPSASSTPTAGTAAAATCTEGNNRVK
jgi:LCP family protein required for cell wall assembly